MKVLQRLVLSLSVLAVGLFCAACSTDQARSIAGPASSLERRPYGPGRLFDQPMLNCRVTPLDVFGNGGGMPFEVACEDMGTAQLQILHEKHNTDGCLIELMGRVTFTNNGHEYGFTAKTKDCLHGGGTLVVCSPQLGGCVTLLLPRPTKADSRRLPTASK